MKIDDDTQVCIDVDTDRYRWTETDKDRYYRQRKIDRQMKVDPDR